MNVNINLTAATANLSSVLSSWARPLANLSELNLPVSTFSRLGLVFRNISQWGNPLANLSELALEYGPSAVNLLEWQARLSSMSEWAAPLANLTETASQLYSALNLSESTIAAWSNISVPGVNWTELATHYANLSELGNRFASMEFSVWRTEIANVSGIAAHLSNYTDTIHQSFKQINTSYIAGKLPGLLPNLTGIFNNLLGA